MKRSPTAPAEAPAMMAVRLDGVELEGAEVESDVGNAEVI